MTAPSEYLSVKGSLVTLDIKVIQSELDMVPATTVELDEDGGKILRLIDVLEVLDDVQNVFTNADI